MRDRQQLWTMEETKRLINLWNLGGFASAVAKSFPGRSRESILGKLSRIRRDEKLAVKLTRPLCRNKSFHISRSRRA